MPQTREEEEEEEDEYSLMLFSPAISLANVSYANIGVVHFQRPQRFASLTSIAITWYKKGWETPDVAFSYGDFPNIPLVGEKGCVNYNPVLSLRQLGYPMNGPPGPEYVTAFLLHDRGLGDPIMLRRIKRAWNKVHRKGKELGKHNCIAREPYTQWVIEREKFIQLPYSFDQSAYPQAPEPVPISVEEVEEFKATIQRLELENEDLLLRLNRTVRENGDLKWEKGEKEKKAKEVNLRLQEERKKRKWSARRSQFRVGREEQGA